MTTQASVDSGDDTPDSGQVAEFLRNHPDFFDNNPELLAELRLSHPSGNTVSLIERQIQVLREQNQGLKNRLMELVDVARDNDRLNERMHSLIIDLLGARTAVELLDRLEEHLRNEFQADTVSILLTTAGDTLLREAGIRKLVIDDPVKQLFERVVSESVALCGRLRDEQLEFLFGEQAVAIESSAVIPLGAKAEQGMLAIGSREVNRFHCNMGTLFLSHLGELLTRMLNKQDLG